MWVTGPVEPVNGINKDVCGPKLLPITVSAYPVIVCLFLLLIRDTCTTSTTACLCSNVLYLGVCMFLVSDRVQVGFQYKHSYLRTSWVYQDHKKL